MHMNEASHDLPIEVRSFDTPLAGIRLQSDNVVGSQLHDLYGFDLLRRGGFNGENGATIAISAPKREGWSQDRRPACEQHGPFRP